MRTFGRRLWLHSRALGRVFLARVTLATIGLQPALRLAAFRPGRRRAVPDDAKVRAVRRAARFVPGSVCLAQSIAVLGLLSAEGVAADLVIGCRLGEDGWSAHAWVEHPGGRVEPVVAHRHIELARCRGGDQGWALRPSRGGSPGGVRLQEVRFDEVRL